MMIRQSTCPPKVLQALKQPLLHLRTALVMASNLLEKDQTKTTKTRHDMTHSETLFAGEKISIENTQSSALAISLECANGCQVALDLLPGQSVGFSPGDTDATLTLRDGDPAGLLVIRPETAT